ncbi:ribokinase [Bradyrhizobium arachidis]|uniref:Ribokinase n=1 Tax=Bradyrhizobium arachidis TaxID=858423 RepID=A0AAE7NQT8_9BRAD|nr:ribokinase [Bradyrhizobium arachidis]QOZ68686.1 ribokinase [Bradyrhizobium arachidis]SFV06018.1 ribokinase [Bradyrhizobium arachidis]
MILVFGSLNIDLVAQVPVIPGAGRTVLAPSYQTHFGGKGANQAVAAARIAGPGQVRMAGCVGRDGFGDSAIENLKSNGVDTGLIVRADEPTGCAFITVDQAGENAITVASGANMAANAADLPAALFGTDVVLVLQMEVPFAQALQAAWRTTSASGTVIWNLAPVPDKMTREMVSDLLGITDYLLLNEHEAMDAAVAIGLAPSGYEAAATDLARTGDLTCIVTAGAQGALAVAADGTRLHAPAPRITPVDTTGAGDTFVGAFAAMVHEEVPLQTALQVGCEAAAQKCLVPGAQAGMPMRAKIPSLA